VPAFLYVVLSCVGKGLEMGRSPIQGVLPKCPKRFIASELNFESEQAMKRETTLSECFEIYLNSSVNKASAYSMEGLNLIPGKGRDFLFVTTSRQTSGTLKHPVSSRDKAAG
jgi:hypothetical protein